MLLVDQYREQQEPGIWDKKQPEREGERSFKKVKHGLKRKSCEKFPVGDGPGTWKIEMLRGPF